MDIFHSLCHIFFEIAALISKMQIFLTNQESLYTGSHFKLVGSFFLVRHSFALYTRLKMGDT